MVPTAAVKFKIRGPLITSKPSNRPPGFEGWIWESSSVRNSRERPESKLRRQRSDFHRPTNRGLFGGGGVPIRLRSHEPGRHQPDLREESANDAPDAWLESGRNMWHLSLKTSYAGPTRNNGLNRHISEVFEFRVVAAQSPQRQLWF